MIIWQSNVRQMRGCVFFLITQQGTVFKTENRPVLITKPGTHEPTTVKLLARSWIVGNSFLGAPPECVMDRVAFDMLANKHNK